MAQRRPRGRPGSEGSFGGRLLEEDKDKEFAFRRVDLLDTWQRKGKVGAIECVIVGRI